jgi:hypothetical protein
MQAHIPVTDYAHLMSIGFSRPVLVDGRSEPTITMNSFMLDSRCEMGLLQPIKPTTGCWREAIGDKKPYGLFGEWTHIDSTAHAERLHSTISSRICKDCIQGG